MSKTPFEMCHDLGRAIAKTEEYQKYKEAEYQLLHNEEAGKIMEELKNSQITQQNKEALGMEISEKEKKEMEALEKKALDNSFIRNSYYANAKFQELMRTITKEIRKGITSEEKIS